MATLLNGINGSFSGKVGDLVGSSWRGIHYVKRVPKISTKPKTEKQLAQQARFALAVRFANPVKDILNTGFRHRHKPATGYNLGIQHILKNAIRGDYPNYSIDYAKVVFSRGLLSFPFKLELLAIAGTLMVCWEQEYNPFSAFCDDEVHVIIYDPNRGAYINGPAGTRRSDCICMVPVPGVESGNVLHVYVFCTSRDELKFSNSVYVPVTTF